MIIIKQRKGEICYDKGEAKVYLSDKKLAVINFIKGTRYKTITNKKKHKIVLRESINGFNGVSEKKGTPIIDKTGIDIREALKDCESIKITYAIENGVGRIIIEGKVLTSTVNGKKEKTKRKLTSISFCSGVGISSSCESKAGFKNIAFCEYNPKKGATDRYANVYQENNPESIMFNIPMQELKAEDLPYADLWSATLDCTDFSKLASTKDGHGTMHLYMHLMRLFWEKPKKERPKAIFIENVPEFEKVAGNSLKLALEEEGYIVKIKKINSLDYGSRTKRERLYLVASCYDFFNFPEPLGRLETPISEDGVMTVDTIDWITSEDSKTLKHFVDRENKEMSHNHKITAFDINKNSFIGTIPKSHHKYIPENILKHPTKDGLYAFIRNIDHLRYLHGIDSSLTLGTSLTAQIEAIGQGVCCNTVYSIAKEIYKSLSRAMFGIENKNSEITIKSCISEMNVLEKQEQLSFSFV